VLFDVAVLGSPLAARAGALVALAHFVLASDCAQRLTVIFAEVAPAL
jgi:hypothetical protein